MESPRSGRPSIFGACERRLVVDDHPALDMFGEEALDIWYGEACSETLGRIREGIVSRLPRLGRLASLLGGGRGMSKLTLRPETGDVGEVKKSGDRPCLLIASVGCADSLVRLLRLPFAKPRLRYPAPTVLGAPPLRGEDLDRRLGDTELDDSSCSGGKSDITSAGCERYGFGSPCRPSLPYGHVSALFFLPLARLERFLKNLDALDYDRELPTVSVRLWMWG